MEPSEVVVLNSGEAEGVPAIPVIVAEDKTGTPERVTQLETAVGELQLDVSDLGTKKADKTAWEVNTSGTLAEASTGLFPDTVDVDGAFSLQILATASTSGGLSLSFNNGAVVRPISIGAMSTGDKLLIEGVIDPLISSVGYSDFRLDIIRINVADGTIAREIIIVPGLNIADVSNMQLACPSQFPEGTKYILFENKKPTEQETI